MKSQEVEFRKELTKNLLKNIGSISPTQYQLEIAENTIFRPLVNRELTFNRELTIDQKQTLYWVAHGMKQKQIAAKMNKDVEQINSLQKEIRRKLGCSSMAHAVYLGIGLGYIPTKLAKRQEKIDA